MLVCNSIIISDLSFLTKTHLLALDNDEKKNVYVTSAKGNQYLEKYADIADLLDDNEDL